MALVTGGTGFVGRNLVAELSRRGQKLRLLVRATSSLPQTNAPDIETAVGDVTQPQSLPQALSEVDTVIHLAAIIREQRGATFHKVNYLGTKDLMAAAKAEGVRRFLYMSNVGAGPNPAFPFLRSKWQAEEEVKASGLAYTIFRSSVIFGQGDEFISTLARLIKTMPLVPVIGSGKVRFQPVWVKDVVACIAAALDDPATVGQTIPLGGPEHLTYEAMLDTIMTVLGMKRPKVHVPTGLMRPIVWLMERLLSHPPVTSAQLAMLRMDNIAELDAIEKRFGFTPTSLREGIAYLARV